jgi:serine phosphatase RsbU (regulator of sigma subunit)
MNPAPGIELLLAISEERTYVIDPEMGISTLELAGVKLLVDPENPSIIFGGNYHFMGFQYEHGDWLAKLDVDIQTKINDICFDQEGNAWVSARSALRRFNLSGTNEPEIHSYGMGKGLPEDESMRLFTDPENGEILVGTREGFYRYDSYQDTLFFDSLFNSPLPEGKNKIMTFHKGAEYLYWFSFENENRGWGILGARRNSNGFELIYDRAFRVLSPAASTDVFYTDDDQQLWFSKANQLFHFDQSKSAEHTGSFQVLMRNVKIAGDSILFHGTHSLADASGHRRIIAKQEETFQPRLKYLYRELEFQWSAPYYMNERQIRYSYFLEGYSNQWSDWGRSRSIKYTNLPHGKYVMKVKARNIFGDESPAVSYAFSISRPWYATFTAIALYIVLSISLTVFVLLYTRGLKQRAELLERQNREIELQKQELENLNEETTAQRDEIEAQRDAITLQKELIGRQKNAMTDSIRYARRIQDAVLPAKEVMRYLLPKHFVFYRPRDIVSGDFFWVDKKDETVWLAVADCTGHGVPGAFMSMLGISLLNEIYGQYSGQPTHEIMDELRDQVISSLGQTGDRYEAKDGMEMALVAINTKTREIQFTGAMQNLYTFQKGELVIIRGDRMPVGIHSEGSTMFTSHKLTLERGDTLYLFSDGYADQFGGKNRKKFGTARLKALLTKLQQNIMHDQKEALKKEFYEWKGNEEQIDDVLMIGIKL